MEQDAEKLAFAERLRLQLQSRYRGVDVAVDAGRFALHVTGSGIDTHLSLSPLHHSVSRDPGRTSALIADWVRTVERQLTPGTGMEVSPSRLLWCVRSHRYLEPLNRSHELVTRDLGGGMTAFIAETLPGSVMRGVPRTALAAVGLDDDAATAVADRATAERFGHLPERIRTAERVPADGWRLSSDALFQGSVVLVPDFLAALAERAGCDVLIGIPDRSLVLAVPVDQPGASRFERRVIQAFREAMNPCSRDLLVTDGTSLRPVHPHRGRHRERLPLMAWLRD